MPSAVDMHGHKQRERDQNNCQRQVRPTSANGHRANVKEAGKIV